MGKTRRRPTRRSYARRYKKKISILTTERLEYVDYKDVNLLRRFISDRAKIRARKVTGNDAHQQRNVVKAIKIAREMALLPYASRVTTQRGAGRTLNSSSNFEESDSKERGHTTRAEATGDIGGERRDEESPQAGEHHSDLAMATDGAEERTESRTQAKTAFKERPRQEKNEGS